MIYLIFFTITFVFISLAKKHKDNKKMSLAFEIIGLSLISFLAAIRDQSIGTDVITYVKPVFELSVQHGLFGIKNIWYNIEIGYKIFNCIIAMFTSNFSVYLFFQQLFIMTFSYYGIKNIFPKKYNYTYLFFMLIFFNRTLNIVRQAMTIAICLYSLKYMFEEKNIKYFLLILFACLFHETAFVFIGTYVLYYVYKNYENYISKVLLLICLFGIIIFFFFTPIINIFSIIGIIPEKYLFYTTNYVNSTLDFRWVETIIDLFILSVYLLFYKTFNENNNLSKFYFMLLITDLVCLFISAKYSAAHRLSMYFEIPALLYFLTNIDLIFIDNRKNNLVAIIISLLISFIIWYCMYVLGNNGNTIPFKSIFSNTIF